MAGLVMGAGRGEGQKPLVWTWHVYQHLVGSWAAAAGGLLGSGWLARECLGVPPQVHWSSHLHRPARPALCPAQTQLDLADYKMHAPWGGDLFTLDLANWLHGQPAQFMVKDMMVRGAQGPVLVCAPLLLAWRA
jgi:hypothetical protein